MQLKIIFYFISLESCIYPQNICIYKKKWIYRFSFTIWTVKRKKHSDIYVKKQHRFWSCDIPVLQSSDWLAMASYGHVELTISGGNWSKSYHLYSFSVLTFLHETRFFSLSFITVFFLSLHVCEHMCVYVHIHAPMHIFKMLTVFFTTHCTMAPLTPPAKKAGAQTCSRACKWKCQSIYKNGLLKQY